MLQRNYYFFRSSRVQLLCTLLGVGASHTIRNRTQKRLFVCLIGWSCSADGYPASKLNTAFVDQTSKTLSHSLFSAAEIILMRGDPGHFTIGDHTAGHGFKKEFSQSHRGIEDDCTLIVWWTACMNFLLFFMSMPPCRGMADHSP